MQIGRTDAKDLSTLGVQALRPLCSGDIGTLADRFGYSLAHGREPATSIRQDLMQCLVEIGATSLTPASERSAANVKYLEPNDSGLYADVECLAPTDNGHSVLVELVVTGSEAERHITLEQISAAA